MNKKLKEQLELVIIQCSALKAKLDEALTRNKQYESEIEALRQQLEERPVFSDNPPVDPTESALPENAPADNPATVSAPATQETETIPKPAAAQEPQAAAETETKTSASELQPDSETEVASEAAPQIVPETATETEMPAAEQPDSAQAAEPAAQAFQSILEAGADMVSQAVAISKEYIARLETAHPEGCSSLTDIIRSRTDLFKVEISGIIGGFGTMAEKHESMRTALVKLIQYYENVK